MPRIVNTRPSVMVFEGTTDTFDVGDLAIAPDACDELTPEGYLKRLDDLRRH